MLFTLILRGRYSEKCFGVGILVRDLCGDLALPEKIVFEEKRTGSLPGCGALGQRMRAAFPVPSFSSFSLAQVHVDCRGPGADGGGVPSLSSLGGELKAFSTQDPQVLLGPVLGLDHEAGPGPALRRLTV